MTHDTVRLALPSQAGAIAALQRRWCQQVFGEGLADQMLSGTDLDGMTASWEGAIARPPLASFRILVAIEEPQPGRPKVVGFAALGPSDDPDAIVGQDGTVAVFAIDPPAQRRGHGSRLLQAAMDTLRADGFTTATWWVPSADDILRGFLVGAGWGPDGAHQELGSEDGGSRLKMVRLHTDISPR